MAAKSGADGIRLNQGWSESVGRISGQGYRRLPQLVLFHVFRSKSVETCGCLSKPLLQSLRSRGSALKQGNVPSRHQPSTNPPVSTGRHTPPTHQPAHPPRPPVFRDQVLKHLENVPPTDFEAITNKLVQAGGTLEFLKYADVLFEILLVGGLLQPGGQYVDDGTPLSPFAIINAKEPVEVADVKQYVEVLNKLIRR